MRTPEPKIPNSIPLTQVSPEGIRMDTPDLGYLSKVEKIKMLMYQVQYTLEYIICRDVCIETLSIPACHIDHKVDCLSLIQEACTKAADIVNSIKGHRGNAFNVGPSLQDDEEVLPSLTLRERVWELEDYRSRVYYNLNRVLETLDNRALMKLDNAKPTDKATRSMLDTCMHFCGEASTTLDALSEWVFSYYCQHLAKGTVYLTAYTQEMHSLGGGEDCDWWICTRPIEGYSLEVPVADYENNEKRPKIEENLKEALRNLGHVFKDDLIDCGNDNVRPARPVRSVLPEVDSVVYWEEEQYCNDQTTPPDYED
jgi:hypothetical protein